MHSAIIDFILTLLQPPILPAGLNKSAHILQRWLPTLMMNPKLHHRLFVTLPHTFIARILADCKLSEYHNTCINLFTELYKWQIYLGVDILDTHVMNGSAMTDALIQLRQDLASAASLKAQRAKMKAFLSPFMVAAARTAKGTEYTVNRMAEKLVIMKSRLLTDEAGDAALELDQIFT